MGVVVVISNYLVQFPVQLFGLQDILTYGAFSYPITFLVTDLANRAYGKIVARKIVYIGFFIGIMLTLLISTNFKDLISGKELINIKIDGNFYEVPEYLITEKIPENFNNNLIRKSLYFTRQIMVNKFFVTNNLLFPKSRVILENYFN